MAQCWKCHRQGTYSGVVQGSDGKAHLIFTCGYHRNLKRAGEAMRQASEMEGGMVLEDGLHPDDPNERAQMEALRQAAEKAHRLYGEVDKEEGEEE